MMYDQETIDELKSLITQEQRVIDEQNAKISELEKYVAGTENYAYIVQQQSMRIGQLQEQLKACGRVEATAPLREQMHGEISSVKAIDLELESRLKAIAENRQELDKKQLEYEKEKNSLDLYKKKIQQAASDKADRILEKYKKALRKKYKITLIVLSGIVVLLAVALMFALFG